MITYTNTIAENKWLFSENNHVLEFSDDTERVAVNCIVNITGVNDILLYPHPDGSFYLKASEYIKTLVNAYEDDLNLTDIDANDVDTFVFDWGRVYTNPDIEITITFNNSETATDTITPNFILGAEQLKAFKKGRAVRNLPSFIMSPLKSNTASRFHLRYWEGYPFDIGLSRALPNITPTQTITNRTNAISQEIATPYNANRIVFSDGDTSITLEDYIPLTVGYNELSFANDMFVDLWKEDSKCGVYVKWLNESGAYNYWLFNEQHENSIGSKSKGFIYNDYNDLQNTVSPYKSLGAEISEDMVVRAENLTHDDMDVLIGILKSPKVYLFTGVRFTRNSFNDWMEVSISNKNLALRDFKNNVPDISMTLNLPEHYTV